MDKKITKDMIIGEILQINPNMAGVLMAGIIMLVISLLAKAGITSVADFF